MEGATHPPGGRLTTAGGREEEPISTPSPNDSWAYAEGFLPEDAVLLAARQRAEEVGCVPILPGGGATLSFLAGMLRASAVVEVGTGTGVSGTYLLRGMAPDGVLTTVEPEAEHLRLARVTFAEEGIAPNRTRTILGRPLDVLPRLADGAYDLVFCDADKREYADYLAQALRLLRPGGIVAFDGALGRGLAADPGDGDPETLAVRELATAVRDDARLTPVLLPAGDGLLVAVVAASHPIGEG